MKNENSVGFGGRGRFHNSPSSLIRVPALIRTKMDEFLSLLKKSGLVKNFSVNMFGSRLSYFMGQE